MKHCYICKKEIASGMVVDASCVDKLKADVERLRAENEQLWAENEGLRAEVDKLKSERTSGDWQVGRKAFCKSGIINF